MKASVGPKVKVKAAGGVRSLDGLIAVQEAGCARCGATATITIIGRCKKTFWKPPLVPPKGEDKKEKFEIT